MTSAGFRGPVVATLLVALLLAASGGIARAEPSVLSERTVAGPVGSAGPAGSVLVAPAYVPTTGVVNVGPVAPSTPLEVVVGLAPTDPQGFAATALAVSEPGSPEYRHFLSAAVASARYAPGASARAAARAYFAGFGLATAVNPDGLLISAEGSAADIGAAFGTSFERFRSPSGSVFVGHTTAAALPAVAPWDGVLGLGNATPLRPAVEGRTGEAAQPSVSCSGPVSPYSPCQIDTGYNLSGLLANGTNGSGVRIGVVDAYSSDETETELASDFDGFTSTFGLAKGTVNYLYPVPTTANLNASGTNPQWGTEEALDLEWARAAAPGATLDMTFSPNSGAGLYFAVDNLVGNRLVDVLSLSWGEPDVGVFNAVSTPCSKACNATTDGSYDLLGPILELAAVEGISTFAASGDCGSADGTNATSTHFPASDPFVTGVGGTYLNVTSTGAYLNETAWSGNASGTSGSGCVNQGGSGGGFSPLPRPVWQHGLGTRGTTRGVPDVSLNAASGVAIVAGGRLEPVGGTSAGTPVWAGIAAVADQAAGSDLGFLNPALYSILASPATYARVFHDITSGSNGYAAGAGWDPVTGIGTPNVGELVPSLAHGAVLPSSLATSVFASVRFGPAPLTTEIAFNASGGSGTYPVLGVDFGDGTSAQGSGPIDHTYLTSGVYSVQSYVIDSLGNVAASPPVVVVVGGGSPLTVVLSSSNDSPAAGTPVTLTATVEGGSAPYLLNVSFGDGSLAENLSTLSVGHAYAQAGGYCAEAVVRDASNPPDGGASARLAMAVGGAAAPSCGNPAAPLSVTAEASPEVRDAPADYPRLFAITGGSTAPDGLVPSVEYTSNDPYISDCSCTIFRAAGNDSVEAWVNDTVNGGANATATVEVAPPLNATFRANTLTGTVPLIVTFTATARGGDRASAAATQWTFGNGLTSTGATAQTTYSTAGEFVAVASLSDAGYGNASEAFVIDVQPAGPPVVGVAGTITPATEISSGANVTFAGSLEGPSASLSSAVLKWELGNGAAAFGTSVTETYFAPTDRLAGDALAAAAMVVGPHQRPIFRLPISLPSFFATEAGGFVPAVSALAFSANVSVAAGVVPLSVVGLADVSGPGGANVSWLFGDSPTSLAGVNVSHAYYAAGEFTVNATAYDAFHDEAVRLSAVVATAALGVDGGPNTTSGDAPLTVSFSVAAYGGVGPPYRYAWALPNGTLGNVSSFTLTFATAGKYNVSVNVSDPGNASLVVGWSISVAPAPPVTVWEILAAGAGTGVAAAVVVGLRRRGRPTSTPTP